MATIDCNHKRSKPYKYQPNNMTVEKRELSDAEDTDSDFKRLKSEALTGESSEEDNAKDSSPQVKEEDDEKAGDDDKDDDDESKEDQDEDQEDLEEKKRTKKFEFDGMEYVFKERPSVIEEQEGKIEFRVVNNDNSRENLMVLTGLKNIFQKQLPKMPREYIARLVYDRSHLSMAVVKKPLTVVGGITYRPFDSREFAEIVFCAISSTEQVRGYGAHLMNHLKDYVKATSNVKYFLTYADNYAIGYFKKQGFTKEITLDKSIWMGYIKDYEGGTLMQCSILPKIRYLDSAKILLLQKLAIEKKIKSISQLDVVRDGLMVFKEKPGTKVDPHMIPGLKEAGWTKEMDELLQRPKRSPHHAFMANLLTELQNNPSSWPFAQPVSKEEVPDYFLVIKEPMDLSTMEMKLENDKYATMEEFIYDAKLIFNNCRSYNGESTTYYKNANKLEKFFNSKIKDVPEYAELIE